MVALKKPGFIEKWVCLENVQNLLMYRNYMGEKSLNASRVKLERNFFKILWEEGLRGELWNKTCLKEFWIEGFLKKFRVNSEYTA